MSTGFATWIVTGGIAMMPPVPVAPTAQSAIFRTVTSGEGLLQRAERGMRGASVDEDGQRLGLASVQRLRMEFVAPGLAMSSAEYSARFGGLPMDDFRHRMKSVTFELFARFVGLVEGSPAVDNRHVHLDSEE